MLCQDIPFHAIHLHMTLQVKAVRKGLTRPFIYLPPQFLNIDDVEDLLGQLLQPFLLLGDFIG